MLAISLHQQRTTGKADMTQYAFTEITFQQSLARARAAEAAELAAHIPAPEGRDISAVLRQQAMDHLNKVLSGA